MVIDLKKGLLVIALLCFLVLSTIHKDTIFQCGNPIPYVIKMFMLDDSNHYQRVFADKDVYITKRYDFDELKKHIEDTYGVTFKEQLGGGFLFISEKKNITVVSRIYWRYYSVWELILQ